MMKQSLNLELHIESLKKIGDIDHQIILLDNAACAKYCLIMKVEFAMNEFTEIVK